MRIVGLAGVLLVATAAQAGTLSTLNGSFNAPTYEAGKALSDYSTLGWSGGVAPTITADGKLNLHYVDPLDTGVDGMARHGITSDAKSGFVVPGQTGSNLCIGFTLNFTANAAADDTAAHAILGLNVYLTVLKVTATRVNDTTIALSLNYATGWTGNTQTITATVGTPIRLVLAVTPYGSSKRSAYLSDLDTLTAGDYSSASVRRSGLATATPGDLQIWTSSSFQATMDDLIVGNSASEVAAPLMSAPVPEPATLLLSLPAAALLLRRKRAE